MTTVQDEQALRAIVAAMEAAWNAGDGEAFAAAMAEDVDFIDVLGRHHVGRKAVAEGHKGIFATIYKGSHVSYAVEKIRAAGEGAVVFVRARLMTTLAGPADDRDRDSRAPGALREEGARPTLTLTKSAGRWTIAVFQNTRIA